MIDKYAALEAKALMKTHTQMLYNWASQDGNVITEAMREALKASCARIYEIIDALPGIKEIGLKNCEGNKLNG